jgi:hypothetical protein
MITLKDLESLFFLFRPEPSAPWGAWRRDSGGGGPDRTAMSDVEIQRHPKERDTTEGTDLVCSRPITSIQIGSLMLTNPLA